MDTSIHMDARVVIAESQNRRITAGIRCYAKTGGTRPKI